MMAQDIHITQVKFIDGVTKETAILYDGTPHVAFIGRSNVGKSSTLNVLMGRKKLVKVGRTPGKTKELNFFQLDVNGEKACYFVDLPGYGYAKLSKSERQVLKERILWYLSHPVSDLKLVVLIIDAKAGLTDLDREMIDYIYAHKRNFILAVNKIDKINQKTQNQLKKEIAKKIPFINQKQNICYYSAFKAKNIILLKDKIFSSLFRV